MAHRSYVLANLTPASSRESIVRTVAELEAIGDVLFAEPVIGAFDLLVTLESDRPIEDILQDIQTIESIMDVTGLKTDPIPSRERMWNNLDRIPVSSN